MKLFLHWLRWDLRRFRVMLLIWTLLVLAHALMVGWFGWKMPMAGGDPGFYHTTISSANFLSALLGLGAIFLLLYVLTTDPAGGSLSFWKVRPPSGFGVAGAKLVICIGAFLIMPGVVHAMVAYWVAPAELAARFVLAAASAIILSAAYMIGILLVGAAAAGSPLQVLVRLSGLGTVCGLLFILALLAEKYEKYPLVSTYNLARVAAHPLGALILLGLGVVVFMAARRSRQPPRIYPLLTTMSPLILVLVLLLPSSGVPLSGMEQRVPQMDSEDALQIRILEPRLSEPIIVQGPGNPFGQFSGSFRLAGLGKQRVVSGRLLDLTFEGPDGTKYSIVKSAGAYIREQTDGSFRLSELALAGSDMTGTGETFGRRRILSDPAAISKLALEPCRASGTIRLILGRPLETIISLDPAKVSNSALGKHRIFPGQSQGTSIFGGWSLLNAWAGPQPDKLSYSLKNPETGDEVTIAAAYGGFSGPFFSLLRQQRMEFLPKNPVSELMRAKAVSAASNGSLSTDWHLRMTATIPWGWVDVPVSVALVVIPGNDRDAGAVLEKLSAIRLDPAASPQERLRLIRYACILADSQEGRTFKLEPWGSDPGMLAKTVVMEQLCESIQPDLTGPLLDWIAEESAYNLEKGSIALNGLRKRLVALIEPGQKERLRSKPEMWAWINGEPPAAGLNPVPAGTSFSLQDLDEASLQERWKKARQISSLDSDPLAEALRRGLPWAIPALAEVVEFLPDSDAMCDLEPVVRRVVDERIPPGEAMAWLAANVHRLVWDATSRKWTLPAPAPDAPAPK